ncbi:putative LPS-assembly lipoprotein RlpB precursor (Rare lipoprotein B) [Vibrio nigripulchritudo SFn27]|uniref:LPS-assembly lipoprotein LptE n=1 Tax=Vibrio nigripulchritudo TaxID=28173 RepID=U4KE02_9VIBR|nr:LPS assembly lipoprotein LptE [Vibrio nigripulchritudo]CCN82330.1 putative LPS-assembly lipoprotein RlpB precursor (Rare lipoprotein B) [Vibrio nigripulchritudo BLFn1]CCN88454.1 putative LPS-assembly lipoprotein RlpB precursor (Rare lipoprotein B) [Vibrio nigripulchritudo SFn27]CCN95862.1 putative LPS-assembly lipoprotein RlpB precursor (Rare lipoprotein B) [Vibrio nigripulchritudo ENn2]CCO39249.1 putative LPS-assembly lipoprotein RlpB precursor (Rare lipoprotein B) [Vibrio nigripulchritudo 
MKRVSFFRPVRASVLILLTTLLSACGFHFRDTYFLPEELSEISFTSFDSYGPLTRYVRAELDLNGVKAVPPREDIPNLHLTGESNGERTLSLYQNSRAAEYELTYAATYRVTVPGIGSQSFTTTVNRSFLDNPLTALAKSTEKEMIIDEMRKQASRQILRQMARLKAKLDDAKNVEDTQEESVTLDLGVTQTTTTENTTAENQ